MRDIQVLFIQWIKLNYMGLYFLKSLASSVKLTRGMIFISVCVTFFGIQTGFGIEPFDHKFSSNGLRKDTTRKLFNLKKGDHVPVKYLMTLVGDRKTKLILLDFWSTYCGSCIASFPKLKKLKQHFGNDLEIVLINCAETEDQTKKRFAQLSNTKSISSLDKYLLGFPTIFKDTVFRKLFPFIGVPHCVWIDGNGKVLEITDGPGVTLENIAMAIQSKELNISQKSYLKSDTYDYRKEGLLKSFSSELAPSYYSAFISYSAALAGEYGTIDSVAKTYKFTVCNGSYLKFIKRVYDFRDVRIFFEGKRSAIIAYGKELQTEEWKKRNLFTYELLIPADQRNQKDLIFQKDVERFLEIKAGLELVKEKRIMKCRVLSGTYVSKKTKFSADNSKQGKPENAEEIRHILFNLTNILEDSENRIVFMDDTRLTKSNMLVSDLRIPQSVKSVEEVKKILNDFGLDILEVEREIEVLVVKDKVL